MKINSSLVTGWYLLVPWRWRALAFTVLLSLSASLFAAPPLLVPATGAPSGMSIVRDAVKIRLYKPGAYYQIYTAEAFNGTAPNMKIVCGVFNALAIEPTQVSFTWNGESWFEVNSNTGDNRVRLIEAPEMISLLSQDGVPTDQRVARGRWAITRIRLVSNNPVNTGDVVRYQFELMCYKPSGLDSGGGILVLGTRTFNLEFPMLGTPMQSLTEGGAFATNTIISPFDFYPTVVGGADSAGLNDLMTDIRSWIWGRDTTFDLAGWTLQPSNSNFSPLAVRDSWNRAFRNVSDHVNETSYGILPLGYATGSGNAYISNASPYFNVAFAADNTQSVTALLSAMAVGGSGWKSLDMNYDLIFHAAPSLGPGGDTTTPLVSINIPSANGTTVTSSSLAISGTASDNVGVSSVLLRVNGGAWTSADRMTIHLSPPGSVSWATTLTLLVAGINTIEAISQDNAGNYSDPSIRSVVYTPAHPVRPSVVITSPSANGTMISSSSLAISGSAGDDAGVSAVSVRVNHGPWSPANLTVHLLPLGSASWTATVSSLISGINLIEVQSQDSVGNISEIASRSIIYNPPDTTIPIVTIASPDSNGTSVTFSSLTVTGTASDNVGVAAVSVRVINSGGTGAWVTANGTADWNRTVTLAAGSNTIEARAQDAAGNVSTTSSRTVTYANAPQAPELDIEQPSGTLLASGGSRSFGSVVIGGNAQFNFVLKNTGTSLLTGLGVSLSGTNASDFTVITNPAASLAAGGQTTVVVRHSPSAIGTRSAALLVASNDSNENPYVISLSGVGTASGNAYQWATLAGGSGGSGNLDGTGSAARFNSPSGVAVDSSGHVYVTDTWSSTIRKISPLGTVTTLAGDSYRLGSDDGTGSAARFSSPEGVSADCSGTLYIADSDNHVIRKITPAGAVTTLAGSPGEAGSADGSGSAARFAFPSDVTVDSMGHVYVADRDNRIIRKITPSGLVTTLAGSPEEWGHADGTGSAARFSNPSSVAVDSSGNVYAADANMIRRITPSGVVTTLAGSPEEWGHSDGVGSGALFHLPSGVAVDSSGHVYVADSENHTIRKITASGVVTTLAGGPGEAGSADGTGSAARFSSPSGVAVDSSGNVYVADTDGHLIRKITALGAVSTLAGKAFESLIAGGGSMIGPGSLDVDSNGNVYVAGYSSHTVQKITPSGTANIWAGDPEQSGSEDGTGSAARFNFPTGVAVDSSGNVFVADSDNWTIRKITPSGVVTTLAGRAGGWGSADGTGSAARFGYPFGVAVDSSDHVYVADASNHTIRKITPSGAVTTLAGSPGQSGYMDGTGNAARFNWPSGVAVDGNGNVFVVERDNHTIRKITSSGVVTTLAGSHGEWGHADGTGSMARFSNPIGISTDSFGNVFVSDGPTMRRISPLGVVTTIGGRPAAYGSGDGVGTLANFYGSFGLGGITVGNDGTLYVSDWGRIAKGTLINGTAPVITQHPANRIVAQGQNAVFTAAATATPSVLDYQWQFRPTPATPWANLGLTRGPTMSLPTVGSANAGEYRVVVSNGVPVDPVSQTVVLTVTVPSGQDTDADGMPDEWEIAHGLNPDDSSDAAVDTDGDGQRNFAEYLAGTHPADAASVFALLSMQRSPNGDVSLTFNAVAGKSYRVTRSSNLQSWTEVAPPSVATSTGPHTKLISPSSITGRLFYRIEIVP